MFPNKKNILCVASIIDFLTYFFFKLRKNFYNIMDAGYRHICAADTSV